MLWTFKINKSGKCNSLVGHSWPTFLTLGIEEIFLHFVLAKIHPVIFKTKYFSLSFAIFVTI